MVTAVGGQNTGSQSPTKEQFSNKGLLGSGSPAPIGGTGNVLYRNNYAAAGLQTQTPLGGGGPNK